MKRGAFTLSILSVAVAAIWLALPVSASGGNAAPVRLIAQLPDPKGPESAGWLILCVGGLFFVFNQGRTAFTSGRPTEHKQPFSIKKADEYVKAEDLLHLRAEMVSRVGQVDRDLVELKATLANSLSRMEAYQHKVREEIKGEMEGLQTAGEQRRESIHTELTTMQRSYHASVGKVHTRCDEMVEKIGKLMGHLEAMNRS